MHGSNRTTLPGMARKPIYRPEGGESFLEGKLLIALPGMADPRFEKAVIFMCAHSGDGAMGIIINKPVDGLGFREMMDRLDIGVTAQTPDFPILFGGPVQTGRGFVLHSGEFESESSTLPVTDDISLTATLDILRAIADGQGPRRALFALGYAGWDGGQIEDEIRANGWIHCDADNAIIFDHALDEKWSLALKKLGIDMSGLSAHTGRA
ncbi:MAG TPA: YqgE/AlgH family protein [Rhizomicrobium sp.]|nr:YqgE/AlgH family protein [Rhizomicrobium sp.]